MSGSLRTTSHDRLEVPVAVLLQGLARPPASRTLPEFRRVEAGWFQTAGAESEANEISQRELAEHAAPNHRARWIGGAVATVLAGAVLLTPVPHSLKTSCRLEPVARVAVSAPSPGMIGSVEIAEGQWVEQGTMLARYRRDAPSAPPPDPANAKKLKALKTASARADAAVSRAEAALRQAGKGARLMRARQRVSRLQETATAAHARVSALGSGGTLVGTLGLIAPASGYVSRLAIHPGSQLDEGAVVLQLEDRRQMKAVAIVPERERITAGTRVEVRMGQGVWQTAVASIEGDRVEALIDNPARDLQSGAAGEVTLEEPARSLLRH